MATLFASGICETLRDRSYRTVLIPRRGSKLASLFRRSAEIRWYAILAIDLYRKVTTGKRNFHDKRPSHRSLYSSRSLGLFFVACFLLFPRHLRFLKVPLGEILNRTEMRSTEIYRCRDGWALSPAAKIPGDNHPDDKPGVRIGGLIGDEDGSGER